MGGTLFLPELEELADRDPSLHEVLSKIVSAVNNPSRLNVIPNSTDFKRQQTGLKINRPDPDEDQIGRLYYATDTAEMFEDTGISWRLYAGRSVENNPLASTSSPTTSSGTFAVMPEMTIDYTPKTEKVLVLFGCVLDLSSGTNTTVEFDVGVDGVLQGNQITRRQFIAGTNSVHFQLAWLITSQTAGLKRTYDMRWRRFSGTGTIRSSTTLRSFQVEDII